MQSFTIPQLGALPHYAVSWHTRVLWLQTTVFDTPDVWWYRKMLAASGHIVSDSLAGLSCWLDLNRSSYHLTLVEIYSTHSTCEVQSFAFSDSIWFYRLYHSETGTLHTTSVIFSRSSLAAARRHNEDRVTENTTRQFDQLSKARFGPFVILAHSFTVH